MLENVQTILERVWALIQSSNKGKIQGFRQLPSGGSLTFLSLGGDVSSAELLFAIHYWVWVTRSEDLS